MRAKPLSIYILAMVFVAVAISVPLQVIALYDYKLDQYNLILANISTQNWFMIGMLVLSSVLMLLVSKLALGAVAILTATVIWNNFLVGHYGGDFNMVTASFASVGFVVLTSTCLYMGAFKVLINRKMQWWKTARRYNLHYPVTIRPLKGYALQTKTFDISKSGIFVACDSESIQDLKDGEFVSVHLTFDTVKSLKCEAQVVRKVNENGRYPNGLGIEFKDMDSRNRAILRSELSA